VRNREPADMSTPLAWVKRGYAYVVQNERGHFFSEGNYDILGSPQDGYDTLAWISSQPWSNGKVGTVGTSYPGGAQHAIAIARIENHYMLHKGWLEEGQLLRGAEKLRGIPGVIVQGRHDCCTPPRAAWELKRVWPEVELNIVPDGGHLYNEPGILDGLIRATDRFAG
jgi:pimeloyl-ACP methyl ester carboxylesterase